MSHRLQQYADTSVEFADEFDLDEVQLLVERHRHQYANLLLPFVEAVRGLVDDDKENQPREAATPASKVPETPKRSTSVAVLLTPAQRLGHSHNVLENFEFTLLVGRGAFASVYRGRNLSTDQIVAIKQIFIDDQMNVRDLMGEIDLLKILKHENIVKYHGFVKTSDLLNIFLEYCSGGSLRQVYKRHQLDEKTEIVPYVRLILNGLEYLHSQGVVHRDVKAANVLIDEQGVIKLADFGVAAQVNSQHHTVVGTPNWMAPETVLGGEGLCTASDIWLLGATIIELFTTFPPYHNRNSMAVLHAILTDEHPPLPKAISTLARDFLLECFQKHPNLRSSAKQLLRHKWLAEPGSTPVVAHVHDPLLEETRHEPHPLPHYTESPGDRWETDFELPPESQANLEPATPQEKNAFKFGREIIRLRPVNREAPPQLPKAFHNPEPIKVPKELLLKRFTEENETKFLTGVEVDHTLAHVTPTPSSEDDPFLQLEIDVFDLAELEIQAKMEFLLTKFALRVDALKTGSDDAVLELLLKITGRMLHILRKYPASHPTLTREHGLITILELLELAPELPKQGKMWYNLVVIVNHLFSQSSPVLFENFCLLGGIPMIFQLRSSLYDRQVRTQVVKFIRLFVDLNLVKALLMLILSGGLRVVLKFVEDDFHQSPLHPLVLVECIHKILLSNLVRSKSDLCRILLKYGAVFWFAVLLHRLTIPNFELPKNISQSQVDSGIDHVLNVLQCFASLEPKVRVNIANPELFKLLIKTYPNLSLQQQLGILKFFKLMSCISDILPMLYLAEILEFMFRLLESTNASTSAIYEKVMNSVTPILYNCCYLNHRRETELVNMGAVPYLKELALSKLPSRQFVLPIFCELVHCDDQVRLVLCQQNALPIFWHLVLDPYWQSNALDLLLRWSQGKDGAIAVELDQATECLQHGFLLPKVANMEATMDGFYRLFAANPNVVCHLYKPGVINSIVHKLREYRSNSVVQLSLLRILKTFVTHGAANDNLDEYRDRLVKALLALPASSLLVRELTGELKQILQ